MIGSHFTDLSANKYQRHDDEKRREGKNVLSLDIYNRDLCAKS